jgi:uroporphyrinogen-III synthase
MRVIVTRPAAQADQWVQSLARHGIAAVALPLIAIEPPADTAPVLQAWRQLGAHRLVVFVSPNAAEQFFALKETPGRSQVPLTPSGGLTRSGRFGGAQRPHGASWPDDVLAATVGPGTSETLKRHGVPASAIVEPAADALQFDSESLWRQLEARDWRGAPVLIVRGDGGREWLADTLKARGAVVSFVAAYRRAAPRLDTNGARVLDDAIARPAEHLWFFSSSEALDHLAELRPGIAWAASSAIATHPRIAKRASDCGFGVIHASRPTLDAVVACIQSIAS